MKKHAYLGLSVTPSIALSIGMLALSSPLSATSFLNLSVAQDAHIQGTTLFGKLADDPSSAGFKVDVVQASYLTGGELIQEGQESGYYDYEVIQHPARTWYEDVYTDIWGMVD